MLWPLAGVALQATPGKQTTVGRGAGETFLGGRLLELQRNFQEGCATGTPSGPGAPMLEEQEDTGAKQKNPFHLCVPLVPATDKTHHCDGDKGEMSTWPSCSVTEQGQEGRLWSSEAVKG